MSCTVWWHYVKQKIELEYSSVPFWFARHMPDICTRYWKSFRSNSVETFPICEVFLVFAIMFGSVVGSPSTTYNINKSYEVPQCPSDAISCLSWFPVTQNNQTFLAGASWDKTLRVWDVRFEPLTSSIQFQPKAMFNHEAPILGCTFSRVSFKYRKWNNDSYVLLCFYLAKCVIQWGLWCNCEVAQFSN